MTRSILFLDDCPERTRVFRSYCPSALTVTTAQEAIDLLATGKRFDIVFLDHDLGGETYVDSERVDCGMEVVRHLAANTCDVGDIIVHTYNHTAGLRMMAALAHAGYQTTRALFLDQQFVQLVEQLK